MKYRHKILVASSGDDRGNDAFGIEVVNRLEGKLPHTKCINALRVRSNGMELIHRLMNGYDMLIIVDSIKKNNKPDILYIIS